ncbi:protein YLS7 isoform X1 [Physcomitrium patens]|uniref:protein YLS7 isoform X1 n=1 Tax=Physcomitrium patens TaxID=3218 RepID=UPI000D1565D2|nr:protein YLS7-like isoform X1 [Physcomitrium patens]XP_024372615.1 protein YLS7-like isoform X1 [Physcomitrium patens]|eukprot:XP_024372606.1 protein YLS7-like isoform X1 [Physcomitrella patens]
MRTFGKAGQPSWVKPPCLCSVAVVMVFTMGMLIAPLMRLSRKVISADDPSTQLVSWVESSNNQVVEDLPVSGEIPQVTDEVLATISDSKDVTPTIVEEEKDGEVKHVLQLPSQQEKQCNIFEGKWIENHSEPLYQNETCPFLSQGQNCPGNGRSDSGYLNWKWKPTECELTRFDGLAFLELMRGKTLAFIGDSVTRNQYEALMCMLLQVASAKPTGNRKFQRWVFRGYDFKVIRIWSSWLVHVSTDSIDFAPANMTKLHLDILDEKISEFLPMFDVLVLASGHWWPKTAAYIIDGKVVGGQTWWNGTYEKKYDVLAGYGVAMKTALKAIIAYPDYKGLTILRTYSPEHYEGGEWNTGGSCTGKTKPLEESELARNSYADTLYAHQIEAVKEARRIGENATRIRVMDITRAFSYRADGHPGPYRNRNPNKVVERGRNGKPPPQDCLHWCMPGPIDTWNEYLFAMLQREFIP